MQVDGYPHENQVDFFTILNSPAIYRGFEFEILKPSTTNKIILDGQILRVDLDGFVGVWVILPSYVREILDIVPLNFYFHSNDLLTYFKDEFYKIL